MLFYALRRLLYLIPVTICVTILVASLMHFIPGDPVDKILDEFASAEQRDELRSQLGLDQPLPVKIVSYFMGILQLDFGKSISNGRPVLELVSERAFATVELAILAVMISILISIPLGCISALKADTPTDYVATLFSLIGVSMPNFWLGPLLIIFFSLYLGIFPVSGRDGFMSYILPAVTLGASLAAILSRMTRTAMMEQLEAEYVKTAYSKGLSKWRVIFVHVLRNASVPIVTIIGLQFGVLLTGAIITEKIFDWPGLGDLMIQAIGERDFPIIQGLVFIFSMTYLIINLATDLLYAWIDPRIKLQ